MPVYPGARISILVFYPTGNIQLSTSGCNASTQFSVLGASSDHRRSQFCLTENPKALYNGVGVVKRHFEVRELGAESRAPQAFIADP